MFKLHPVPDVSHACPYCGIALEVRGWYIPGMRNLADLKCTSCGREFYGDLIAGQAVFTPLLVERASGKVHDPYGVTWFADWLSRSYARRTDAPLGFQVEELRPVRNPLLLNCLDTLYGHALLKLFNAQYYLDKHPEMDLIVLVPRILRWLVPAGVAAIWTVDLPMGRGTEWNDWLAAEIRRRVEPLGSCWLSVAHSHPHPLDCDIERFTGVSPFPAGEWEHMPGQPVVTFVWRDDRLWCDTRTEHLLQLLKGAGRKAGLNPRLNSGQKRRVIRLAAELRRAFPGLRFSVVGMGQPGGLPEWINDQRTTRIDTATERRWCEEYARSAVVIGVHGSNMLLPSAHAGAVIELLPADRWGNLLQDLFFRDEDTRETLFRIRVLPCSTGPGEVAGSVISLIKNHNIAMLQMGLAHCRHSVEDTRGVHLRWKLIK